MCSAFPTQVPKRRQGNNALSPNIVGGCPSRSEVITDDPQTSQWRFHPLRPAPSFTEICQRPKLALAETVPPLCATEIDSLHHAQGHWQSQIWPCLPLHCGGVIGETPHVFITGHAKQAALPCPLPTQGSERMRCLTLLIGLNGQLEVVASQGLRGQLYHPCHVSDRFDRFVYIHQCRSLTHSQSVLESQM